MTAPTTEWVSFNVNSYVRVKLTPEGLAELREQGEKLRVHFPKLPEYTPPVPDADGWYKFQAWNLMADLGHKLYCGASVPFETEIQFEVERRSPEPGERELLYRFAAALASEDGVDADDQQAARRWMADQFWRDEAKRQPETKGDGA